MSRLIEAINLDQDNDLNYFSHFTCKLSTRITIIMRNLIFYHHKTNACDCRNSLLIIYCWPCSLNLKN